MNTYSIPLNFDLPLFNTSLAPAQFLKSQSAWADNVKTNPRLACHFKLNWETDLSNQLKQFFLDHGQEIRLCEIFYRYPNTLSGIHSDDKEVGDYSKMNWILGGEDSEMHWYTINESHYTKIASKPKNETPINSYSILYLPEDVTVAYSENVRGPAIVQVGVPHNIRNGNQERWCVSIVFRDPNLGRRPTMLEAKEIFKQYLV
jgi:hypothetical protein